MPRSWTPRSLRSPTPSGSVSWTGWWPRRRCGSTPRPPSSRRWTPPRHGTSTSTSSPTACSTRPTGSSTSRPAWMQPTPWTWSTRSVGSPQTCWRAAPPRRSTCAAPRLLVSWPGGRPRSTSLASRQARRPVVTARRPVVTASRQARRAVVRRGPRRGRWCCTCTSPRPPWSPSPTTAASTSRGSRRPAASCWPTRSATGAPAPTSRSPSSPSSTSAKPSASTPTRSPTGSPNASAWSCRTASSPTAHRPARSADLDHTQAYDKDGPPGQTSTDALAPLCRKHHRVKTHPSPAGGTWTYRAVDPAIDPGAFIWRSPHGLTYRVDPTGTTPLS